MLSLLALLVQLGAQFTCFTTRTKVQILRKSPRITYLAKKRSKQLTAARLSLHSKQLPSSLAYLLYWSKSANTDAESAASASSHSNLRLVEKVQILTRRKALLREREKRERERVSECMQINTHPHPHPHPLTHSVLSRRAQGSGCRPQSTRR